MKFDLNTIEILHDNESNLDFKIGDIIKIIEDGTWVNEYIGRIESFNDKEITIDCSEKYQSKLCTFFHCTILSMELIER